MSRVGGKKQKTSVWAVILKEVLVKLLGPYVNSENEEEGMVTTNPYFFTFKEEE